MSSMNCDDVNTNPDCSGELSKLISSKTTETTAKSEWQNLTANEIVSEIVTIGKKLGLTPAAYIVTNNRGNRYLVFAGSTEYDNAIMFNYEIKPLYE